MNNLQFLWWLLHTRLELDFFSGSVKRLFTKSCEESSEYYFFYNSDCCSKKSSTGHQKLADYKKFDAFDLFYYWWFSTLCVMFSNQWQSKRLFWHKHQTDRLLVCLGRHLESNHSLKDIVQKYRYTDSWLQVVAVRDCIELKIWAGFMCSISYHGDWNTSFVIQKPGLRETPLSYAFNHLFSSNAPLVFEWVTVGIKAVDCLKWHNRWHDVYNHHYCLATWWQIDNVITWNLMGIPYSFFNVGSGAFTPSTAFQLFPRCSFLNRVLFLGEERETPTLVFLSSTSGYD